MTTHKRLSLLILAVFSLFLDLRAHPVDQETARTMAVEFMGTRDVTLSAAYQTEQGFDAFYIFNTTDGFVIVAANDCETPIIGYSHEGRFDPDDVPVQLQDYLQVIAASIQYGIEHPMVAKKPIADKATAVVAPLLTDRWHQGCLYNSFCPAFSSSPCGHAEVGCVAVAMGQIMHYWDYPSNGWGSHSYTNLGTMLSADFGSTTYDWDHIPDSLTEQSSAAEVEALATLLYHCGVAVDMKYRNYGSTTDPATIPNAMVRYFDYGRDMQLKKKDDYGNEEWLSMLKHCLDQQRPIIYVGFGSAGHAFVCDGYDSNDLFHFNWGWGGNANGFFTIGNLNPNGHDFNNTNYAILDIIPQYDPCHVFTTAHPSSAGTVEGGGEYHLGALCTVTATPTEDYVFSHWEKDGQIRSNNPSYTFAVEDDTILLEAYFSCIPVGQFTANYAPEANNPNSPRVRLSWSGADTEWKLLKQFDIGAEVGDIATDGEHIYVTYAEWNDPPPFYFGKFTMDGALVEKFNMEDVPRALCLTHDGTSFYCNSAHTFYEILYRVDLDNKTVLDSIDTDVWFGSLTYDPDYDGFWLGKNYQAVLYNRQGQRIKESPSLQDYINGSGYYSAKDGTPHLLIKRESGIYDYDINNNVILDRPLFELSDPNNTLGACIATYDGKDAMFIVIESTVLIYEIKSQLEQIVGYRIFRADAEGNAVLVADEVSGTSYTDATWETLFNGVYRYGIRSIYANGSESEIVWSEPIAKTNYSIDEIVEPQGPAVQKIIEDGHLYILVNGKKYSVTGQEME